jgi:hypothetical protein
MLLGLKYLFWLLIAGADNVSFQSDSLNAKTFQYLEGEHFIRDDDGARVLLHVLLDEDGILYWYRKVRTPVCLTGECRWIEIGLYWDCTGDFFGLEVYNEHLTKTDHTQFSSKDYEKLLSVLRNDWSILREYEQSGLLNEQYEEIDGTSGATKKEIAEETVEKAVYTTYTIWHLIHAGEKEQIILLTLNQLSNPQLLNSLLYKGTNKHVYFVLDQFGAGNLSGSDDIVKLTVKGLSMTTDPIFQNIAIRAVSKLDLDDPWIQEKIAEIYPYYSQNNKLKILSAFNRSKLLTGKLYEIFSRDLSVEDEWYSVKILEVLKYGKTQSTGVIKIVQRLRESGNSVVRAAATEFLEKSNAIKHNQ